MQRVLVLGGATGLLGQALVRELQAAHAYHVETLGRTDGDIFDPSFLTDALHRDPYDLIFNTIAMTQVDAAEDHVKEAKLVNAGFPEMLGHILQNMDCHVVHFSTDFVFDGTKDTPYTEEDSPRPQSVYGATKLQGEDILLRHIYEKTTILRTAWLFGAGRKNFVTSILDAARKNGSLRVVNDQTGSPTYTEDLARWSVALAERRVCGLFHAVNSGSASWYDLASRAVSLAGIPCTVTPISSDMWPQKAKRPSYSVLDTTQLQRVLGEACRPWQDALEDFIRQS